jgi:hypothetical protein
MKHDALRGEMESLCFQIADGNGLLTANRLIIDPLKYDRGPKTIKAQPTELYDLRDFEKAVIVDETLYVCWKRLENGDHPPPAIGPSILQEIEDYIEEAAK